MTRNWNKSKFQRKLIPKFNKTSRATISKKISAKSFKQNFKKVSKI